MGASHSHYHGSKSAHTAADNGDHLSKFTRRFSLRHSKKKFKHTRLQSNGDSVCVRPEAGTTSSSLKQPSSEETPHTLYKAPLRPSASLSQKSTHTSDPMKPISWQADERLVRNASCSFFVKYLGSVQVFESRGMQVCEEALKLLRSQKRKAVRSVLQISGDTLRVIDQDTKGLIVDQTIEKVSFCAPDRNVDRGFSYICRDGTTRRWLCHGFLAVREAGERLSHAVGCAFAVCLERKQKRDKQCDVTMQMDSATSSFTRVGSFRPATLGERISDPQKVKPAESVPLKSVQNPYAVERPHAPQGVFQRQGSLRVHRAAGNKMADASPFKRQYSICPSSLPSYLAKHRQISEVEDVIEEDQTTHGNVDCLVTLSTQTPTHSAQECSSSRSSNVALLCNTLTAEMDKLVEKPALESRAECHSTANTCDTTVSYSDRGSVGNCVITATQPSSRPVAAQWLHTLDTESAAGTATTPTAACVDSTTSANQRSRQLFRSNTEGTTCQGSMHHNPFVTHRVAVATTAAAAISAISAASAASGGHMFEMKM